MKNHPVINDDPILDGLLNKLVLKLDTDKMVFDGLNCRSSKKGITREVGGYYQRYLTNYGKGLEFIGSFMNDLESALYLASESCQVNNYVFPTEKDIDGFISLNNWDDYHYQVRKNILNDSPNSIQDWLNQIISKISKNDNTSNDRVNFVTSKVGSGKTTFVNYLITKYQKSLADSDIVLVKINYSDFGFKSKTELSIFKDIQKLVVKKCVQSYLENTSSQDLIDLVPEFIDRLNLDANDNLRNMLNRTILDEIDTPKEKAETLNSISCVSDDDGSERCINKFFKYISRTPNLTTRFLIIIDGFDALDPEMLQRYYMYIDQLKNVMYGDMHGARVIYILTLRTCTYEVFGRDNSNMKYLVAPNELSILGSALDYIGKTNKFVEKTKQIFIEIFTRIMSQIEKNLNATEHRLTIVQIFDYNYRLLLRYLEQVVYFIIDDYTQQYEGIKSLSTLAEYLAINDYKTFEKRLQQKWYIVFDILLIKSRAFYIPPYSLKARDRKAHTYTLKNQKDYGDESKNRDMLSFVDDIYNYIVTQDMLPPTSVFPLLLKFRILQLYSLGEGYVPSESIYNRLCTLGYETKYFPSILEDLHNAKFLKVICEGASEGKECGKKYNITNRGLITINELAVSNAYLDHVIPWILLPSYNIVRPASPHMYIEKRNTRADEALIVNYSFFINVVRSIEAKEKENIGSDPYYSEIFISGKIHDNYITSLRRIVAHKRRVEGADFEQGMETILTAIDW